MRRRFAIVVAVLLLTAAAGPGGVTAPAQAIDDTKGHPGYCKSGKGVTVVVDFQKLGGTTIVRCFPSGKRGTGLDALKGAGFQITGAQRWGEAFICRVENRPSAIEKLSIKGNDGYKERCIDTPPAAGYWSYWHAGNNCPWKYSQWGVKNRDYVTGGFEGWSFSLNATAETNPKPRIAAVRPGTEATKCTEPYEPSPSSNNPHEKQPGSSAAELDPNKVDTDSERFQKDETESGNSADDEGLPEPKPRADGAPVADDPANNVEFTGGEDAPDVRDVLKKQSGASDYAPWVAGGAIALLLLTMFFTERRRRRLREG